MSILSIYDYTMGLRNLSEINFDGWRYFYLIVYVSLTPQLFDFGITKLVSDERVSC